MIDGYAGGIGKTVKQTGRTFTEAIGQIGSDSEFRLDVGQVPIASKFYSSDKAYFDYFTYRDNVDMIQTRRREQKDPEVRERFRGTNRFSGIGDNGSLYKSMRSAEKALDRIKTQKEKAREIEDMGQRLNKLHELEQQEAHYMRLFNKRINDWKKATKQD